MGANLDWIRAQIRAIRVQKSWAILGATMRHLAQFDGGIPELPEDPKILGSPRRAGGEPCCRRRSLMQSTIGYSPLAGDTRDELDLVTRWLTEDLEGEVSAVGIDQGVHDHRRNEPS
jgi:hypothetical protein